MPAKKLEESENSEESPCENSNANEDTKSEDDNSKEGSTDFDSIVDVSRNFFDFPVFQGLENAREVLYMYKNVYNLIPRAVGGLKELKSLKFFGNELNLFPLDFNEFLDLESLQLKVPQAPGLGGLDLEKLKALKELELSRVPLRPSAFPLLSELAGLKYLTKLSICHFSIRYLPPEIGHLSKLEYLDLSFNKMRNLPSEIIYLNSLTSLKVANNKLVELHSGLCSLQNLENLDLSSNRLTSLDGLDLGSMHSLRRLNLQFNKLLSCCQIPSWICCNLEGNGKDMSNDEFISASAEMDVLETAVEGVHERPLAGSSAAPLSYSSGLSPSNRSFAARNSKGWKRRYSLQQRARQERLNSRRKNQNYVAAHNASEKCIACTPSSIVDDSFTQSSTIQAPQFDDKEFLSGVVESENSTISTEDDDISLRKRNNKGEGKCSCGHVEPRGTPKKIGGGCSTHNESLNSPQEAIGSEDECLSPEVCKSVLKLKRHSDRVLDNPKPSKYRRPTGDHSAMSSKYSRESFCSIEDYLPDGFYDAGRDRPFMPLSFYEKNLHLDSREVILVDRTRDERLDAAVQCAQALVSHFLKINGGTIRESRIATNTLQTVSLLAFFVSDHFGGSDKSGVIQRTRKVVSGSNYTKPFVCTCSTGNEWLAKKPMKESSDGAEDIVLLDLCERSLQSAKARRNSIVVPLGSLQFGVCRHRALLMKYLCDRLNPPIPCELVRGFLDFSPHAWNVIAIRRGQSWVRMIVDACHPHDIREETDPEYFSRYVPLSRINISSGRDENSGQWDSFPSLSSSDEIGKSALTTLIQCKVGSCTAAAKVRKLEMCGASVNEIRNFELNCLGEARILGSLNHPCIVKYYGHQISSKWAPSSEGNSDVRVLQSAILMEHIKGGSLKCHLEKLARAGDKHIPVTLALFISRDIAHALTELHSKHIIHRDIKSENILINLDEKDDGSPIVKLGDFDRAVPLRSSLHSCCIAHIGIPPPDICVGTPRWMAPEVLHTMEKRDLYGLEVDIWSFGCLLLEMLTLQVPYLGLSESDISKFLKRGERPQLSEELEKLTDYNGRDVESLIVAQPQCSTETGESENESETLRFLVALYRWCTEKNPTDRPTASKLYKLLEKASSGIKSRSLEQ